VTDTSNVEVGHEVVNLVEDILGRLDMVEWDRFVEGNDPNIGGQYLNVYGWIDRDDDYKDFVMLRFWPKYDPTLIGFTTSSDEHTEEIHERIYGEETDGHNACKRVEHTFDVENAIELTEDAELESFA